jgi:sialic acid synthase SpsE
MTTIFDLDGLKELGEHLKVFKIASPDITNYQLLDAINEYEKPVLLSTAGATIEEIRKATVRLPACEIAILHCTALYPTPPARLNLSMIEKLNDVFNNNVIGWSSHNPDVSFAPLAYRLGANIFEYHFKMDVPIQGGDYSSSITTEEVKKLKTLLSHCELAYGNSNIETLEEEKALRENGRRSLYAAHTIQEGQRVDKSDFIALRPTVKHAFLDSEIDEVVNKVARNSIFTNRPVYYADLGIKVD